MTEEETGRLIYLSLLGILLLASFLGVGRVRIGTTIKQAATWVGVFCVVILVYAQRDVLEAQFFPATAQRTGPDSVTINRSLNGSFQLRIDVNGVTIPFLVDTGATDVVLSQQAARRVGIDVDRLVYSRSAMTANGRVGIAPVRLDTLSFSGIEDRNIPASVNQGELGVSLLGMSYLKRFERIEIRGNQMLLIRR